LPDKVIKLDLFFEALRNQTAIGHLAQNTFEEPHFGKSTAP
jgi:hypothetical protein